METSQTFLIYKSNILNLASQKPFRKKLIFFLCFFSFFIFNIRSASFVSAEDWPQWRGPDRTGVLREKGLVAKFDLPQWPILWRASISNGYSGPTVANGRVFVMDRLVRPVQKERVLCFDTLTGKQIWSQAYDCIYQGVAYPNGPRASVTIQDYRAYSLGTMGNLHCYNAEKGDIIWSRDLYQDYKIRMPVWGIAASPLVEGDVVIVPIGGAEGACLVALDKTTGKEIWRALNDALNYSSPIVIDQAGRRVLICWTAERLVGLDPASGTVYWQQPFSASMGIATPVVADHFLFVSDFFEGSLLLHLHSDQPGATLVWQRKGTNEQNTDSLHCCISTPIMEGNYIYGVDSYGELRCLERLTGNRIWESLSAVPKARWANIHMVRNGQQTWMFNERGELIISQLSPQGYQEISRAQLINPTLGQLDQRGGVCWTHPAFANQHVYIRNDEEIVCASLKE